MLKRFFTAALFLCLLLIALHPCEASSWGSLPKLEDGPDHGYAPSIALDASGNPSISYYNIHGHGEPGGVISTRWRACPT